MGTNNPQENSTRRQKESAQDRKRAKWARSPQARRLLEHYRLSLDGQMPAPLFGVQKFDLSVYDEKLNKASQLVLPSLDYLSQDLGFTEQTGVEAIKRLKIDTRIEDIWLERLIDDALVRAKRELQRYLRNLRPLLLELNTFLYCTAPSSQIVTDAKTGQYDSKKGNRPLLALPTTVEVAELRGCSREKIEKELAPMVAWLIPKLILYRTLKLTDDLQRVFDGWLDCMSSQQKEQMLVQLIRYNPTLMTDEIARMLFPKWLKGE